MQEDFYTSVLEKEGIRVTIPDAKAIETINRIIFDELCLGLCEENSKQYFLDTIHQLYHDDKSIDSIILGCTEIGLLLEEKDSFLPLFDTTLLHVNEALHHAL
jgi:aspartate racemase